MLKAYNLTCLDHRYTNYIEQLQKKDYESAGESGIWKCLRTICKIFYNNTSCNIDLQVGNGYIKRAQNSVTIRARVRSRTSSVTIFRLRSTPNNANRYLDKSKLSFICRDLFKFFIPMEFKFSSNCEERLGQVIITINFLKKLRYKKN